MVERRNPEKISENNVETIDQLVERVKNLAPSVSTEKVTKAYQFSEKAHEGQVRRSGEPYISHPLGVAGILTDLGLDEASIITGLLHDTVEDTEVSLEDVEKEFGKDVRELVDGVTKISQMKFKNTHEKQGENIRKMIIAMGKDIRVILVKLADRLHNMRTLNHMPYEKQERIARETLDIYAPLANRLGISSLKVELEDLSFRYMRPDLYYDLVQKVSKKKKEREKYVEEVTKLLQDKVKTASIECSIDGRPKHLYSVYKKMEHRGLEFEQIYDLMAFRVIVDTVAECYTVLGLIHSSWKPVPGRFKDYIALAKSNNYQSLHTTVIGPNAERIEVQIRTHEMHLVAERGIAAHWKYKEKGEINNATESKFRWLRDILDSSKNDTDSNEYLENIKTDLFEAEIYVFTPQGDVKELPEGATPIDFAYAIHTDVGSRCVGAKVNGKIVPLKFKLRSGDTVSVMTSPSQTPSKDWLSLCITSRAKSKIRAFVKSEERKRSAFLGKDLFEKELRKRSISVKKLFEGEAYEDFLRKNGFKNEDEIYIAIGYGKITPEEIVKTIKPSLLEKEETEDIKMAKNDESFLSKVFKSAGEKSKKKNSLIRVDGMSDILVRFAKCCTPIPGDSIVGFISRGRGVTVHTATCPKAFEIDGSRRLDVEWADVHSEVNNARIRILSLDEKGLLRKISDAFTSANANIINARIRTTKDNKAVFHFDIQVRDTKQLAMVIQNVQRIKGVIGVERE